MLLTLFMHTFVITLIILMVKISVHYASKRTQSKCLIGNRSGCVYSNLAEIKHETHN